MMPTLPPYPECPSGETCYTWDSFPSVIRNEAEIAVVLLNGVHEPYFVNNSIPRLAVENVGQIMLSSFGISESPNVSLRNFPLSFQDVDLIQIERISISDSDISVSGRVETGFLMKNVVIERGSLVFGSGVFIRELEVINCILLNFTQVMFDLVFDNYIYNQKSTEHMEACYTIKNSTFLSDSSVDIYTHTYNFPGSDTLLDLIENTFSVRTLYVSATASDDNVFDAKIIDCTFQNIDSGLTMETSEIFTMYVHIKNSLFSNNAIGLFVRLPPFNSGEKVSFLEVEIENTKFSNNLRHSLFSAFDFFGHKFIMKNVSFQDQKSRTTNPQPAIEISGPVTIIIEDCLFDANYGPNILRLFSVDAEFKGNSTFSNNIETIGGALSMVDSFIFLNNGTTIGFFNNTSLDRGGAILIEGSVYPTTYGVLLSYPACTYQLPLDVLVPITLQVSLIFENNSAVYGGDNIFGAALQGDCSLQLNAEPFSYQIQDQIFEFRTESPSPVSGIPRRVCLCAEGQRLQCAHDTFNFIKNIAVSPGEKFNVSLAVVGDDFGLTVSNVYAIDSTGPNNTFMFLSGEVNKISTIGCKTDLEYSIQPNNQNTTQVMFLLSPSESLALVLQRSFTEDVAFQVYESSISAFETSGVIQKQLLLGPVFVNVTLLPCPAGLVLDLTNVCNCEQGFPDFVFPCSVSNEVGFFSRGPLNWIGRSKPHENASILTADICPFNFCLRSPTKLALNNSDSQCNLNRTGILCGGCPSELSLAIGSSRCIDCENSFGLALFVFFIFAGIVLVFFLKLLHLTIDHGTINGLIFYINIVWIYQELFFNGIDEITGNYSLRLYFKFLKTFIAWLNLDFGIQTCFFHGLDAYYSTWLQFVFPIYLFIISGTIVLVSYLSTRATKWFGINAVPVLVTLSQLSATKLLQTTVLALTPTVLKQFEPSGTRWVWLLDGNVEFFGLKHSFLAIISIVVLFVCSVFCTVLLFPKYSRRLCQRISPNLALKLKYVLDIYTGPLKTNHQYWVGLLQFIRLIMVILIVLLPRENQSLIIALIIVFPILLATQVSRVYKKMYVFLLEWCSLLNLIALGIAFLGTGSNDIVTRGICTCASITVSFVLFLTIIIVHIYLVFVKKRLMESNLMKSRRKRTLLKQQSIIKEEDIDSAVTGDYEFVSHASLHYREAVFNTIQRSVLQ